MADDVARRRTRRWLATSMAAAGIAFVYRYGSHSNFSNDHFIQLARAQAMLAGDWPIRDYMEEGIPLTVLLSATAGRVLGQSPFAELVLCTSALAAAAGVTCWLTIALTRSAPLGLAAALLQAVARPRLYSYPKLLLYPMLALLAWRYLEQPTRRRLAGLAGMTVVAFLMRHDHGVYTGLGAVTAVAVANWRGGTRLVARRLVEYGVLGLLFVAPYLAYAEYHGGVVAYFQNGIAISRSEAGRTVSVRAAFDPLPPGAWVERQPPDRALTPGPRLLAALTSRNQAVALYWCFWALPLAGAAWLLVHGSSKGSTTASKVLVLVVIVAVTNLGLFREPLEARAADLYGVVPVLGGWVAAVVWRWSPSWQPWRWAARFAVVLSVSGVLLATTLIGEVGDGMKRLQIREGPLAVMNRLEDVTLSAHVYPWQGQWPAGNGWRLARYVRNCTRPGDRLLMTWNKPEMNFWSGRPFAGGETLFVPAFRPPAMFAARALTRLRQQSVPIVLVEPTSYESEFRRLYPDIAAHLAERYDKVGHFGNDTRDNVDVYVERRRTPTGVDHEFQWPCFR